MNLNDCNISQGDKYLLCSNLELSHPIIPIIQMVKKLEQVQFGFFGISGCMTSRSEGVISDCQKVRTDGLF
jgi:hypothetical protein